MHMNWKMVSFAAIIILLYVPLTIVGANTFFPEYSGYDSGCYSKYPYPATPLAKDGTQTSPDLVAVQQLDAQRQACETAYQSAKNEYESQKYIAIMVLNVLVLLFVIFVALNDSIRYGLIFGVAISSFITVLMYQQTKSRWGFIALLIFFALCIWLINKEKDLWIKQKPGRQGPRGRDRR